MHIKEIIETIKERRADMQVTQESLAELAGISLRTLKLIESGNGNPTLKTLQKIADVIGMEIILSVKNIDIVGNETS